MSNPAKPRFLFAFAVTASLVLLWGLGHRLHDTLLPLFAEVFELQGVRLALISRIYNFVYIVGALPAALYARRFGYKAAILLGLGLVAVGAFTFYPAAETRGISSYAVATTCMAAGWLTLEIAANPLFAAWGDPKRAVFRLNLAQNLYPIGALAGIAIGRWLLHSELALPKAAFSYPLAHPYIVLGACILLVAFVIEETAYPPVAQERRPGLTGIGAEIKMLLAQPLIRYAMLAQFCAITATGLTFAMITYAVHTASPFWTFVAERNVVILCMVLFAIGRLIGTALMAKIAPATVLLVYTTGGCCFALIAAFFGGSMATLGLMGLTVCVSLTWPTILGLAIQGLGPQMKVATALVAIAGAIAGVSYNVALTASGGPNNMLALPVAALCCAMMAIFAWRCRRPEPKTILGCQQNQ